ncbi:MAG: MFS transporter, partial [Bacteroidetes bacterium]|nr:MFS transporter [Bacteroidota bacterium]
MDITKKRELFGWSMYDFANSGYATTILASVLPIYFVSIVPEGGASFNFLGFSVLLKASAIWAYTMS